MNIADRGRAKAGIDNPRGRLRRTYREGVAKIDAVQGFPVKIDAVQGFPVKIVAVQGFPGETIGDGS